MNPWLEFLLGQSLLLDLGGVIGLGLLGVSSAKLARSHRSRGGMAMALGAIALLAGRLYFVSAPHFMTQDIQAAIGPVGIAATIALPPLLLSGGLAAVVWGLWAHERQVRGLR